MVIFCRLGSCDDEVAPNDEDDEVATEVEEEEEAEEEGGVLGTEERDSWHSAALPMATQRPHAGWPRSQAAWATLHTTHARRLFLLGGVREDAPGWPR